jgi:GST-like protein
MIHDDATDASPANPPETEMTIELHTWNTPNGRKISVALEEMELPYNVIPINITKGEQMAPDFLAISPNNKIPAIVDPEGALTASASAFSSPVRSCSISARRPANFCPSR